MIQPVRRCITGSLLVVSILALVHHSSARPSLQSDSCGYQACNGGIEGMLNVHLVPHTHDDVGWLKTVDQYYYGAHNDIQKAGVQYIIDSVIDELQADPKRRFIYVEMAFFTQWWKEQTEEKKDIVRNLVDNGRLEFINGGWCMNDEATAHYADVIDQMSLGLNILNETFGECGRPRVSWQIDPFGHSREQAAIFAQMGYDGLFFGRLDHQDKDQRQLTKSMEMLWQASNTLGDAGSLFTGVNYNLYQAPGGFCFDILCDDDPIIDNVESREYNVEKKVQDFLNFCEIQAKSYASDHIMLTMGGDFTYTEANLWYKNMDKLIKYANARQVNGSRYNLFYSTPSCYVKSLNDAGKTWPTKSDDFFPYSNDDQSYWTGYFTSRPALKYMVRQASNTLQSCKQMASALSLSGEPVQGDVSLLKEALGIMQHHDAVSGTEKQHVAEDYARILHQGLDECHKTASSYYQKELTLGSQSLPEISHCQLNISQCSVSESSNQFVINVYNSLSKNVDKYVRVPVEEGVVYEVLDPEGKSLTIQSVPTPDFVQSIPGRASTAKVELVFKASDLPPLGLKSYYVHRVTQNCRFFKSKCVQRQNDVREDEDDDVELSNENLTVVFDKTSGLIKSVEVNGQTNKKIALKQEFLWYHGFKPADGQRASGAYIFRPTETEPATLSDQVELSDIFTGPLVQEIHQKYSPAVSQTIRLYKDQEHVEFDWVVGPIPVKDKIGKEIINRITTDMKSDSSFYTDANGRQTLKRILNNRPTWEYKITEPVAGNYYPINSHIFIKDSDDNQLTLLVDRAQGGSSLHDGQLELMVHRRLLDDDGFGVGEGLNEMAFHKGLVVRGKHYLILSDESNSARLCRSLSQQLYREPQISFITPNEDSFQTWQQSFKTQFQAVSEALPDNINLLTMENHQGGTILIRLEHLYDAGEDAVLSKPVTVSLDNLFPGHSIQSVRETMLGGNQYKEKSHRLSWKIESTCSNVEECGTNKPIQYSTSRSTGNEFELQPMDIRTFIISF